MRAAALISRRCRALTLGGLAVLLILAAALGTATASTQSNSDRAFLAWAIQIEIQQQDMGRIAERRADAADVRDLGAYLAERHRQAQKRLEEVANALKVSLSDKLSETHLAVQRRFSSIPSADFDQAFIRHEISDYRYFLAHFEAATGSGGAVIRRYAASEIARLREDQAKILGLARSPA